MDKFDKWTVFIISVMILYTGLLLVRANGNSYAEQRSPSVLHSNRIIVNPELDRKIEVAKNLLIQNSLEKSETLVNSLLAEHPYEGKLYMLRGDIHLRRQQPVAAMYEYKEAVSLNPDFLDKKTKLFQGKKIKRTVEEAMAAIETGLQKNPDDNRLKDDRQVGYFMKRVIAGSCG